MDNSYLTMGRFSYGNIKRIGKVGKINVGSFTSIAGGVKAVTVGHNIDWVSTFPFTSREMRDYFKGGNPKSILGHPKEYGDISIGNDVWIGYDVILIGGISIGDGSVIGSGSVVAHDVYPYSIEAGNPSCRIRFRFSPSQVERLLDIKWWNWDIQKIEQNLDLICSNNIEDFLRFHS